MRDEYVEYVHGKSESDPVSIKVEQVNLGAQLNDLLLACCVSLLI